MATLLPGAEQALATAQDGKASSSGDPEPVEPSGERDGFLNCVPQKDTAMSLPPGPCGNEAFADVIKLNRGCIGVGSALTE